ncbi:MAG: acyl-CoA thioesterase [Deltaproteobacteria bacterium]|nr:acyl-CoA thioesterase [Deltaproteobacteria bacterium]
MNEQSNVSRTKYRVIYGDTDLMGVVYYGNYPRLFERGRAEFVRERGLTYKEIEERGFALPVTKAFCHYHQSAYYDDLLIIETSVGQIKRASMRFDYKIFQKKGDTSPLVTGYTLHACTNHEGRIVRIPEFVLSMLDETAK